MIKGNHKFSDYLIDGLATLVVIASCFLWCRFGFDSKPIEPDAARIDSLYRRITLLEQVRSVSDSAANAILSLAQEGVDITRKPYTYSGYPCLVFQDKRARYAYQLGDRRYKRYTKKLINDSKRSGLFSADYNLFMPFKGCDAADYYQQFFTDPVFVKYEELVKSKRYRAARKVLDVLSSKTEDVDFNADDPYSIMSDTLVNTTDYLPEDLLLYAKYDLASISENARLRYLMQDSDADKWLTGAFMTGVRYLDPEENLLLHDYDLSRNSDTLFQSLVPYMAVNYNNSDPRWVYNTALFIKGTSAEISVGNSADLLKQCMQGYQDVKNGLSEGECAIEIVKAPSMDFTEDTYKAVVIRPEWESPRMVTLAGENEINDAVRTGSQYSDCRLSDLIWSRLSDMLTNGEVVYLSSAGVLNLVNLSALPCHDGTIISDHYNVRTCISTRNPLRDNHCVQEHNAVLLGGLNYSDPEWKSLPETGMEVDDISSLLVADNAKVLSLTCDEGTKPAFLELGFDGVDILHIATHGFFYPAEQTRNVSFFDQLARTDNSLSRCGLILAGPDAVLSGNEIASMDLSSVDLVALSACDSGLGDVTHEGVSGLQRAFRKAGSGSLLMTLSKVDDKVSALFMDSFYSSFIRTGDKNEAYSDAVNSLRHSEQYNEPRYWAPFILIR